MQTFESWANSLQLLEISAVQLVAELMGVVLMAQQE